MDVSRDAKGVSCRGSSDETNGQTKENNNLKMVVNGTSQSIADQETNGSSRSRSSSGSQMSIDGVPDIIRRRSPKLASSVIQNGDSDSDQSERRREEELVRRRSASVLEVTEHAHGRLREELLKAQEELHLKDEECKKLMHVQDQMSIELEELTAKLFEEANKMVQDANIKRMTTEKLLKEATAKIDVLQAEVTALKTLVITSTPSMPNKHLHPQLEAPRRQDPSFIKGHRRSTSHHNLRKDMSTWGSVDLGSGADPDRGVSSTSDTREVDPVFFEEFKSWRTHPSLSPDSPFLTRVFSEDILPCVTFPDNELSKSVLQGIMDNLLTMEPVAEKNPFPRKCALTHTMRPCMFRIKLVDNEACHFISQLARNRITAVGDFVTYVRYITQGLVKGEDIGTYWEILRLRKQMSLARLGLS